MSTTTTTSSRDRLAETIRAQYATKGVQVEREGEGLHIATPGGRWALLDKVTATCRDFNRAELTAGRPAVSLRFGPTTH